MTLYAESSAVLAWLFGEADGEATRAALSDAKYIITSGLTLVECDRVLVRAVELEKLKERDALRRQARLAQAVNHWTVLGVDDPILERARRAFPKEPIRTLDALHLASAIEVQRMGEDVEFLTLDKRLRTNARAFGFQLVPK